MAYIHPSSYAIEIRNSFHALKRTIDLYRDAITYLLSSLAALNRKDNLPNDLKI